MESETSHKQVKCALCGRGIHGTTIVTHLGEHRLEFDKRDCELIFSRLTSVYGIGFGLSLRDS